MTEPRSPKSTIEGLRRNAASRRLKRGFESFHGFGVMGLTFRTGHVLALRHWAESSIGPPYTSIWHRTPSERWDFWSTAPPALSCNRYAGESVAETRQIPIEIAWPAENALRVTAAEVGLEWTITVKATPITRMMGVISRRLPWSVRTHPAFLKVMGPVGGKLLRAGRFNMMGRMPNHQLFIAAPGAMWIVTETSAHLGDLDLGRGGPLPKQASVGDFLMPQRGVLAAGSAYFEELDPTRHSTRLVS